MMDNWASAAHSRTAGGAAVTYEELIALRFGLLDTMSKTFARLVAVVISLAYLPMAAAQPSATGLVDMEHGRQFGLMRSWSTQVHVDAGLDKVVKITEQTSFDPSVAYAAFDVTTEDGAIYSYTERDRGPFGRPLGVEGAQKQAQSRIEILAAEKKKAKLSARVIPNTILMVQTRRGVLHVLDAETGRTMWSRNVGRVDYPSTSAGANDQYVAMANGVTLYVYHRADGRLAWERKLGGAPNAGPGLSKEYVFVPLSAGKIEAYRLAAPRDPSWAYKSAGNVTAQPVATARSVAWSTERGYMYVSRPDNPGVRFRLETNAPIVTQPAYRFPLLYAVSQDGNVYAVHETAGGTIWRFEAGMPIDEQPVAIGKAVFVTPERGGMYMLDADTGKEIWRARAAQKFLAASPTRVYALDGYGKMSIVDGESGSLVGQMRTEKLDIHLANQATDRIYLGTSSGLVQCLHESDLELPMVYVTAAPKEEKKAPVKKPAEVAAPMEGEAGADATPAEGAEAAMPMEGAAKEGAMKDAAAAAEDMPMEKMDAPAGDGAADAPK
jgi:outer membrane protein assembly factor BamB